METAWATVRTALDPVSKTPPAGWTNFSSSEQAALIGFADLYARHLRDENDLVYPAALAALAPDALQAMSADMMQRRGLQPG